MKFLACDDGDDHDDLFAAFQGKEGVFDVRTRPWGEGTCIEPTTSIRPLKLA
jgi:hypothetical protein